MGVSSAIGSLGFKPGVCTSTTRPAAPYEGQLIFETDTDSVAFWDGSYWRYIEARKNLFYNGAMQVAQRGTPATSITAAGYYTADRWIADISSFGTWTQSVENDAPTGSGFRKSLKMLCTTADASPSASDYLTVQQRLEGQDLQAIRKGTSSAQQLTVSFWVKSNVTGTYIFEMYDNDNARQCSKSYTISASGVWEFKILTFPADTTGAFDNDNALSLYAIFWLGAGSNYQSGTLNTSWAAATTGNRVVGQVNVAAATNNYWQVTGVQLNVGSVAAPFEFKSFGEELALCQRYYYMHASGNSLAWAAGGYYAANDANCQLHFPVSMRVGPSFEQNTGTNYYYIASNGASDFFDGFVGILRAGPNGCLLYAQTGIAGTAGYYGQFNSNNASSKIAFYAEF